MLLLGAARKSRAEIRVTVHPVRRALPSMDRREDSVFLLKNLRYH